MYNGCILRYGIIIFHKTNHRYLKSQHPASGFFISNLVKLSRVLVNYSEFPNCSKLHWNRAIISSLMYQGLDYQITDVIQLNRVKFIFNRAEKEKTEHPWRRPAVSDF